MIITVAIGASLGTFKILGIYEVFGLIFVEHLLRGLVVVAMKCASQND